MQYLTEKHSLLVKKSFKCVGFSRAAYYKVPEINDRDKEVIDAINKLLERHGRWVSGNVSRH